MWLGLTFFQEESTYRFVSFASLGFELSTAALFCSLELRPGITQRLLLALTIAFGVLTGLVFAALASIRL